MVYIWVYSSCDSHDNYERISCSDVLSGGSFFDNGHMWQKSYKREKVAFKAVSKLLRKFPIVYMKSDHYMPMEFTARS